jgi:hypothetical protein
MGLGWHAEGILTLGSLESLDNPARLVRLHEMLFVLIPSKRLSKAFNNA